MIIGVDVDGVIVDLFKCAKKELKKYSFKVNGKRVYNKKAISFWEMYGMTQEQDVDFWEYFIWEYAEKVKVYNIIRVLKVNFPRN